MKATGHVYYVPAPFFSVFVNLFLLAGEPAILVDSGVRQSYPLIRALFAEAGLPPEDLRLVVNTHAHWDHIGSNRLVAESCGALVATGRQAVPWITDHERQFREFYGAFPAVLSPSPEQRAAFFEHLAPPWRVDVELVEGCVLHLGPAGNYTVLHTPGHLDSSICLWEAEQGVVITGDAVAGTGAFGQVAQYDDVSAYRRTLARLAALHPRLLLASHFPPLTGEEVTHFLTESLAQAERQGQTVWRVLSADGRLRSLSDIARTACAILGVPMTIQAVITMYAHLRDLRDQGRAAEDDGGWRCL